MAGFEQNLPDRIYDTFFDKTVFLTGATGFLGKVILERLLRLFDVRKIYVLIRTKKGKSPEERLEQIFSSPLFDKVRALKGDAVVQKCEAVSGDLTLPDLNLSVSDRLALQREVEFVFHSAATVKFDEPLKSAVAINTKGTNSMVELAKEMENLKLFIHISTTYCHPEEKILYEKYYPTKYKVDQVIQTMDWLEDKAAEAMKAAFLDEIPNTYTLTKALAEDVVANAMDKIPAVIVRPSIVVPIWKEPIPGWTDSINGPTGMLIAAGKGVMRSMYGSRDVYSDFISADGVADYSFSVTAYSLANSIPKRIFNASTGNEIKLTWGELIDLGKDIAKYQVPFDLILWCPGGDLRKCRFHQMLMLFLTQLLPALILDPVIACFGYQPFLWKAQKRILNGIQVLEYYTYNQWIFNNDNLLAVRSWLNDKELSTYVVETKGVDHRIYFEQCTLAARRYILKEPDENLPRAKRVMKVMIWVDRIFNFLLKLLLAYLFYRFILLRIYECLL